MARIAFVGCGFVADYYIDRLSMYPSLELLGVMDRDHSRAERFANHYGLNIYNTLEDVLSDERVQIVVNLTNPRSHYEVSRACLEAGKHVYSEKPLATSFEDARALVQMARAKGLYISSAPCNVLGETAQTIWKLLREDKIGKVRVVYAEMDDGPIHQMHPENWITQSGSAWPFKDEYEVGCTLEHAGYYITWLVAFFGRVKTVTSFASIQIPHKHPDVNPDELAPDLTVACLHFESGVVARLTCSVVAPHDHSVRIIGDKGVLTTNEAWHFESPVYLHAYSRLRFQAEKYPYLRSNIMTRMLFKLQKYPLPLVRNIAWKKAMNHDYMDYARGIAELASAIREQRPSRLSDEFSLHVNEVVLAIQNAGPHSTTYEVTTQFEEMTPMPWAQ